MAEAQTALDEADAAITAAEAAFAAGDAPESALDVRGTRTRFGTVLHQLCRHLATAVSSRVLAPRQDAVNAKDAAQRMLDDARGKLDAASVALESALAEEAQRVESRK